MNRFITNISLKQEAPTRKTEQEAFKSLIHYLVIRDPATINLRFEDLITVTKELKQEFNL